MPALNHVSGFGNDAPIVSTYHVYYGVGNVKPDYQYDFVYYRLRFARGVSNLTAGGDNP